MKKYLKYNLFGTCLIIVSIVAAMELWFNIADMRKSDDENIRQKKEELNQEFCERLYINEYGVEFIEGKIDIAYMTYCENKLIQDLSYYNRRNKLGDTLTVEDVMSEYSNFCNNTGGYVRLKAFCDFDVAEQNPSYREELVHFYIRDYTGEKKAFDDTIYTGGFDELTSEEMWELCDAYFAQNGE